MDDIATLYAASSYQDWFRVKAGLLDKTRNLISAMLKHSCL